MIAMRIIKTISPVAAKHTFFLLALFWKTQNQKKITMATKKKERIQMIYDASCGLFTHLPHFVIYYLSEKNSNEYQKNRNELYADKK